MRIGNRIVLPWSKKNFLPRIIVIGLFLSWVLGCGFAIINEYRIIRAQKQEEQTIRLRREELQRREASYQRRMLEEQQMRRGVQNAVDRVQR